MDALELHPSHNTQRPVNTNVLLSGLLLTALLQSAAAQEPALSEPRFDIRRFDVTGSAVLSSARIEAALKPWTGPGRTFGDVQRARAALEQAYHGAGYRTVQVRVPEQEVAEGVVSLKVIEGRLGSVIVEGNANRDRANVSAALPSLISGRPPNTAQLSQQLRLSNQNPTKQTTVLLRPGEAGDEVDAVVRVADEAPARFSVSLDNTGDDQTGDLRLGLGFQHSNLFNRDQVLTLQYVTAPYSDSNPDHLSWPGSNVEIFGAGYHIPLYALGDSVDLIAGYSNVDSGVVQGVFNVTGSGTLFAARYNRHLPAWKDLDQRLILGFDWRNYDNSVVPVGTTTELVPDVAVHPVSLTYAGDRLDQKDQLSYYVGVFHNIPGGANGDQAAFDAVRPGAPADYTLGRAGFDYVRAVIADWRLRLAGNAQYSPQELVPGEQYGVGGLGSVRGFEQRAFTGDSGYYATVEAYAPDLGPKLPFAGASLRALAFVDFGGAWLVNPQPFEVGETSVISGGLGIRMHAGKHFSLLFDYGWTIQGGGIQSPGTGRPNFSLALVF